MASFWGEIKRRKVFRVAAVYAVVSWLIVQVVGAITEPLSLPDWFDTFVIVLLAIGFPIALILGWIFDFTADGIRSTGALDSPGKSPAIAAPFTYVVQGLVLLAVGFLIADQYFILDAPRTDPARVIVWDHVLESGERFRNVDRPILSISQDGSRVIYNALGGVRIRDVDDPVARLVPDTQSPISSPVLSPDGESLSFLGGGRGLRRRSVSGGSDVQLADFSGTAMGDRGYVSWDNENTILYSTAQGIWRVGAGGSEDPVLILPADGRALRAPQLLPGGQAVLLTADGQVGVYDIEKQTEQMLFTGSRPRYVATGHIVYADGAGLSAVAFDLDSLTPRGSPVSVIDSVDLGQFSVASEAGTLAYVPGSAGDPNARSVLAWVDRDGNREDLPLPPRPYRQPRLSPDGSRVAVQTTDSGGNSDIWLWDLDGQTAELQMPGPGNNLRPLWHPDGEYLVFASDRDGSQRIYIQHADFTRSAIPLTPSEAGVAHEPDSWHPNGRTLSFSKAFPLPRSIWTVTVDETLESAVGEPVFVAGGVAGSDTEERNDAQASAFFPDGNWIIYRRGYGFVDYQLVIAPFPGGGEPRRVTVNGGSNPLLWSPAGQPPILFFRRDLGSLGGGTIGGLEAVQNASILSIRFSNNPGLSWGSFETLPIAGFSVFGGTEFDITPEGDRFITVYSEAAGASGELQDQRIRVIENWFSELERLVPTD